MSASDMIDEFGDPDSSPRADTWARVAHALPVVLVAYAVYSVLRWFGLVPLGNLWMSLLSALPLFAAAVVFDLHREFARLCLRCMQEVPADAPVRAARYTRLLWLVHDVRGWRIVYYLLGLGLLAGVVKGLAGWESGEAPWLYAPGDLLLLAFLWGEWKHHRYRPWCPYCRRWDDGGGMREPAPDPVGDGTKAR